MAGSCRVAISLDPTFTRLPARRLQYRQEGGRASRFEAVIADSGKDPRRFKMRMPKTESQALPILRVRSAIGQRLTVLGAIIGGPVRSVGTRKAQRRRNRMRTDAERGVLVTMNGR